MNKDNLNYTKGIFPSKYSVYLLAILFTSLVLRAVLIFKGGPLTDYDEREYFDFSNQLYNHLINLGLREFFTTPVYGHWGCVLWGVIPLFIQVDSITPEIISAMFFSIPSVINIYLVFKITIALKLTEKTALLSAALYALSVANIYMARHIQPYDLSLLFFLVSFLFTLTAGDRVYRASFFSGLYCFICFFTYYGFWVVSLLGLILAIFYQTKSFQEFVCRAGSCGLGFLIPLVTIYGIMDHYGYDLLNHLLRFSRTARGGDFQEGYYLPFLFLYHAEFSLLFVWVFCLGLFFYKPNNKLNIIIFSLCFVYSIWVVLSNFFEVFVLYGRLVKQWIPFWCLLSGYYLSLLDKKMIIFLLVLVGINFLFKYYQMYGIVFDKDFNIVLKEIREDNSDKKISIVQYKVLTPKIPQQYFLGSCHALYSVPDYLGLKFIQYDGMNAPTRSVYSEYSIDHQILACPRHIADANPGGR